MPEKITAIAQSLDNGRYQVLTPVSASGLFDAEGNEISGFTRTFINIDSLNLEIKQLQIVLENKQAALASIKSL